MLDRPDATDRPARRTALIVLKLSRNGVDIAALSEIRLADEGSITEDRGGYSFFWRGLPQEERRIHGVGIAVKNSILEKYGTMPVGTSERQMKLRIPLVNNRYATILSIYAPTLMAENEDKDRFYEHLDLELNRVPSTDKLLLLGDFNARVGTDHVAWSGVIGGHGCGRVNDNGHRLLITLLTETTVHNQHWLHS